MTTGKLGKYDILCDLCGTIIPDGYNNCDNHITLTEDVIIDGTTIYEGDTICTDCVNKHDLTS